MAAAPAAAAALCRRAAGGRATSGVRAAAVRLLLPAGSGPTPRHCRACGTGAARGEQLCERPPPDYVQAQLDRLKEQLEYDADVASGKRPARGSIREKVSENPEACGLGGALAALAGGGLYWWLAPAKADAAATKAFLEEKEHEEGVVKLPSGLMYKILEKGQGTEHPRANAPCRCHYQGTLISGEEFDSSYKRGEASVFTPTQVIKAWTEAMQLMVEGDKWKLYVPPELGYGDKGSGSSILGGSALVFEMELLQIMGGRVPRRTEEAAQPSS